MTKEIKIGNGATTTTFDSVGEVVVFSDPTTSGLGGGAVGSVNTGLYEIIAQGSACTFNCSGSVLSAAGTAKFNLQLDDATLAGVNFLGNTIANASTAYFLNSATLAIVTGNTFDSCGAIYPQGSKFENNTIANTTEAVTGAMYGDTVAAIGACKNVTFNEYTGKYAVYIPATVVDPVTFDGYLFDGSGTDVYWAGTSGTLTVNKAGGANPTTYASAGGTVAFTASFTLTLTLSIVLTQTSGRYPIVPFKSVCGSNNTVPLV